MSISDKLNDPKLTPEEESAIIGAFVRRQKREALGERWAKKLASDHQVQRSTLRSVPNPKKTSRLRKLLIWSGSAAAAVLLILLLTLPQLSSPERSEVVAQLMMEVEIDQFRGESTDDFRALQTDFARQFNAGNYSAAVATGELLVTNPIARPQDALNLGIAYLNAGELSAAESSFRTLLDQPEAPRTEATFYLALTQLKLGQEASALDLLRSIREEDGASIYRKAQRVLSAN